jgi:hypothetical protein
MSATLEADAFAAFFHNPSIIRVPGRRFPVQVALFFYCFKFLNFYSSASPGVVSLSRFYIIITLLGLFYCIFGLF